jgi:hypothetical protein
MRFWGTIVACVSPALDCPLFLVMAPLWNCGALARLSPVPVPLDLGMVCFAGQHVRLLVRVFDGFVVRLHRLELVYVSVCSCPDFMQRVWIFGLAFSA